MKPRRGWGGGMQDLFKKKMNIIMALSAVSSHPMYTVSRVWMRTCGPDKSSKIDRKTQINIEIRDCLHSKTCVCVGGGGGGIKYSVPSTAKSGRFLSWVDHSTPWSWCFWRESIIPHRDLDVSDVSRSFHTVMLMFQTWVDHSTPWYSGFCRESRSFHNVILRFLSWVSMVAALRTLSVLSKSPRVMKTM